MTKTAAVLAGVGAGVIAALALVFAVLALDRERLVDSCQRVNLLRLEVADRGEALLTLGDELAGFVREAADARAASGDTAVARRYSRRAEKIEAVLDDVDAVRVVDCRRVIPLVPLTTRAREQRERLAFEEELLERVVASAP